MILGMLNLSITSPLISRPDTSLGRKADIVICSVECACITKGNRSISDSGATVILLPSDHINFTSNREQFASDFELSIIASNKAKGWLMRQFSKLTCGFARIGKSKINAVIADTVAAIVPKIVQYSNPNMARYPFYPLKIGYKTAYHIAVMCSLFQSAAIIVVVIIIRLRR